jgi:hypothetical protein
MVAQLKNNNRINIAATIFDNKGIFFMAQPP